MRILMRLGMAALLFGCAQLSLSQTTAFKYQGSLTDGGNAGNGSFQMQFRLFDAPSGGVQQGTTLTNLPVTVTNGVFTVSLDFGASVFSGAGRWLEISVRHNSGEPYVMLSPREQVASSPYAVRTLSATTADALSPACISCVTSAQINSLDAAKVTGTVASATNSAQLGGLPASDYVTTSSVGNQFIKNQTTQQTANFNISGNALVGGLTGLGADVNGNFRLDSFGSVRAFSNASAHFVAQTTGGTNTWARFYMRSPNRSWFIGTSQNFNGDQFYLADETAGQTRMVISTNGNVGFGTTAPNTLLTLNGGAPWTSNAWTASMNLQNASALGWEANASGQRFGIGQSGGGLYFFRTNSTFGDASNPANYDMGISDAGNITQPLDRKGLPKAMINVDPNGNILRCYNGITGASTGNCGFSASRLATGIYLIDFGFQVNNRMFSLSFRYQSNNRTGMISTSDDPGDVNPNPTVNQIYVLARDLNNGNLNSTFYVIVY